MVLLKDADCGADRPVQGSIELLGRKLPVPHEVDPIAGTP